MLATRFPGNYFSFREKEGMISYMPKGKKQEVSLDGLWKRKGRQSMKPSRWIKLMLNPRVARKLKDHLYAEFNTIVQHEESKGSIVFSEVDIKTGYSSKNFVLGINSCMWDDPVKEFYESFDCMVLVAAKTGDGKFWGRALVWRNVEVEGSDEKITYMDRIYCKGEDVSMAFREHAIKMGWWRKAKQSNELEYGFITPDGDSRRGDVTKIKVAASRGLDGMGYYPYLDSFRYGGKDWVSNLNAESIWQYGDAHGGRALSHALDVQGYNGVWIERATAIRLDTGYWYARNDPSLVTCQITGDLVTSHDAFRIDLEPHNVQVSVNGQEITGSLTIRSRLMRRVSDIPRRRQDHIDAILRRDPLIEERF